MKPRLLYFIVSAVLAVTLFSFCIAHDTVSQQVDEQINYIPYYHDKKGSFMMIDCIMNDSIAAPFETDSGVTGSDIVIDSAFFFQHFDAADFSHQGTARGANFYRTYFKGAIDVQVGDHRFTVNSIVVESMGQREGSLRRNGILGSKLFENKVTLIDFEKRRMAFVDSMYMEGYEKIPLNPERGNDGIGKRKFIRIGGFLDKNGEPIPTQFLFDTGNTATAIALNMHIGRKMSNVLHNPVERSPSGYTEVRVKQIRGTLDSLIIGSYALKNPSVGYSLEGGLYDVPTQSAGGDGLLGFPFLSRFNLAVDYINNVLYIKPNDYYHTGLKYFWDSDQDEIYQRHQTN